MQTPLRILKVLPFFAWRYGGSVEQAKLVCRELARRGHQVTILTTDLGETEAAVSGWSEWQGCRLFRAAARPVHRLAPYLPPSGLRRAIVSAVPAADVVCSNVGLTLLGSHLAATARRHHVPYVYNAEGALCPVRLRLRRLAKALFVPLFERAVLRGAAALHAVSRKEADDLEQQGADPAHVHVIPNGVDVAACRGGDRQAMRAAWCVPADATVVLFLGRLHAVKGLDLMLAAAVELLRTRIELRLVIAGPDDGAARALRREAARLGVAERVLLPGPVSPARRADALAAADVFALTSRSEGQPNAVLEAAAAGLPLWLTTGAALPEVVEFDAGVVDPPDVAVLARSLRSLLDDANRRRRCGENAHRMVGERFAIESLIGRLEALYRSL
jgi:glycosyltransferase involved in cell wall biosynthesis